MSEYYFLIGVSIALMIALISPGPSFLIVARTSVALSRAYGVAVAVGLASGSAILAIVAALGLYVVLETIPWLYLLLKIVGGLFLCYIAYRIWKGAKQPLVAKSDLVPGQPTLLRSFMLGLATNLSNPKTAVVFGSVFAAFLPSKVPEYAYLLLTILSFLLAVGWYGLVAVLLSTEKAQNVYSSFKTAIDRTASCIMAALGIKLVSNQ